MDDKRFKELEKLARIHGPMGVSVERTQNGLLEALAEIKRLSADVESLRSENVRLKEVDSAYYEVGLFNDTLRDLCEIMSDKMENFYDLSAMLLRWLENATNPGIVVKQIGSVLDKARCELNIRKEDQ